MSRVIDEARSRIERALEEIDAERQSLRSALASLDGGSRSASTAPTRPRRRRAGKRRAAKGQRRDQFLAAVREQPGIKVSEIAKMIGLAAPNALYPLAKKLVKEQAIKKQGDGYAIRSSAPTKRAKKTGKKSSKAKA